MRPRDVFEASIHAALTKYKDNVAAGMYHVTADNTFADAVLKAADRYAHGAAVMRRRDQVRARDLDAALAKVMEGAS